MNAPQPTCCCYDLTCTFPLRLLLNVAQRPERSTTFLPVQTFTPPFTTCLQQMTSCHLCAATALMLRSEMMQAAMLHCQALLSRDFNQQALHLCQPACFICSMCVTSSKDKKKKRRQKTTPFGLNSMRNQALYLVAQNQIFSL